MAGKLVKCKVCGEMIAKEARVCPHCGAKRKRPVLGIAAAVVVFLVILAAVGGGSGPRKVGETSTGGDSSTEAQTEQGSQSNVFGVGDQVELNNIVVTLLSVMKSGGKDYVKPSDGNEFILCEFEIVNNSSSEIAVSSMLSFNAYIDDYAVSTSLTAQMATDKSQLDGTVAAGKKMSGVVGYEAGIGWNTIEIRFTPDFWTGRDIIFKADNS